MVKSIIEKSHIARRTLWLVCMLLLLVEFKATAQNELSKEEIKEVVVLITTDYKSWKKVSIDGKLRMKGLPVSPSLKIFMEKEKSVIISVRVPLLGEMGRIEVSPDSLVAVNRSSNVYTTVDFAETDIFSDKEKGKTLISYVQSMLLNRMIVLGKGELSHKNSKYVDFSSDSEGGWVVVPKENVQPSWGSYGYLVYPDGKLKGMIADFMRKVIMQLSYNFNDKNRVEIGVNISTDSKSMNCELQFDSPEYESKGFSRFSPGKSYKKVMPSEFIRTLGLK